MEEELYFGSVAWVKWHPEADLPGINCYGTIDSCLVLCIFIYFNAKISIILVYFNYTVLLATFCITQNSYKIVTKL